MVHEEQGEGKSPISKLKWGLGFFLVLFLFFGRFGHRDDFVCD